MAIFFFLTRLGNAEETPSSELVPPSQQAFSEVFFLTSGPMRECFFEASTYGQQNCRSFFSLRSD